MTWFEGKRTGSEDKGKEEKPNLVSFMLWKFNNAAIFLNKKDNSIIYMLAQTSASWKMVAFTYYCRDIIEWKNVCLCAAMDPPNSRSTIIGSFIYNLLLLP